MIWWLWFAVIQLVNIPLFVAGLFINLWPRLSYILWLFWNDDDPPGKFNWGYWRSYYWLALRNPVSNLRHVRGVSGSGRPLLYWANQKYYIKIGWESGPPYYPVFSLGSGRGY